MKTRKFSVLLVALSLGFQLEAHADMKVKSTYSTGNQTNENTLYTKGQRQRIETGPGMAIISQRDTKQTIQLFEHNKTYVVVPPGTKAMDTESTEARQGGVVQYSVTITDTGETQMMFGYAARRILTVTVKEPGAGACDAVAQTVEMDGWYIDYEPELPIEPAALPATDDTCRDEMRHNHVGNGKLGFPLGYTAKIVKAGQTTFMKMTVVDFTTSSLDASLFEIPSGYKESTVDMAMSSLTALPAQQKPAGALRVCVGEPVNRTGKSLSGGHSAHELVARLIEVKVDAVALAGFTATSLNAIDLGVANDKQCDYVLTSEVKDVKKASGGLGKFGGMLNKASSLAAGGAAPKEKVEAKVDAKLASLTGLKPLSFSVSGSNGGGFGVMSAISLASTALGYGMFMKMFDPSMISAFSGLSGGMGPAGRGVGGVTGMPTGGFDPGLGAVLSVMMTTQSLMAPNAATEEGRAVSDALKEAAKKIGEAMNKK